MTTLTLIPAGTTLEAEAGSTLLQALRAAGVDLATKCDGRAECGACHVFIHDGRKNLSRIGPVENARLDAIVGVGAKSRLACQAVLGSAPVAVELLGFV